MKLSPTHARVLAAVRDTIDHGEAPTIAAIGARCDPPLGSTSTRKALRALEDHGVLRRVDRVGQPSDYEIATPTLDPNATPTPTPTLDPNDPNAPTPTPPDSPRGGARPITNSNPSSSSRQPFVSGAHANPDDPNAPTPQRPDPNADKVAEVGQTVVGWAVAEQRRLGKAPLDGALRGRIGSVAKRMVEGGVSPVDLKLAAETLVQRDMTDLQAAHRKAQSGGASSFDASPLSDVDSLAARAEASKASRAERIAAGEQENESPHRPEEMVEVAWFVAYTWGQRYSDARLAAWSGELRRLPMPVILSTLRKLVRRGEHPRFPPTWGEILRIGSHDFDEWLWRSGQRVPPTDDPFAPPWGGE